MKIPRGRNDNRCVFGNIFLKVSPLARQLNTCLVSFRPAVHEQGLLITKSFADIFFCQPKFVVIERPRSKRQLLCLAYQSVNDARMTVALVNGTIGRKKIEITFS